MIVPIHKKPYTFSYENLRIYLYKYANIQYKNLLARVYSCGMSGARIHLIVQEQQLQTHTKYAHIINLNVPILSMNNIYICVYSYLIACVQ